MPESDESTARGGAGTEAPEEPAAPSVPEGQAERPVLPPVREWWSIGARDSLILLGAVLVIGSLALKVYALRQAYFVEDDFLFVGNAASTTLTFGYLTDLHKGHLMPGALLLAYAQTAVSPYNWPLTAGVMLAFQAASSVAMFRLLWVVFGRRWFILTPLVVYVFAPLTLPVLTWWSAALNAVPFQLAIVLALLWTVHYLRTADPRYAWWAAGAVVFGMAFSVKAMFLPPLLFVVAAAFFTPGRLPRSLWRAFDANRGYWLGMAALTVGHLLLYLAKQESAEGEGAGVPKAGVAWDMSRRLLGETFPVGAAGGPLQWGPVTPAGGLLDPGAVVLAASWSALAVVVLLSVAFRRRGWRAWALLAGYVVCVDVVPTLIARGRYEEMVGYDPRYVADAALVFAVCLAFAFMAAEGEEREDADGSVYRRRPPLARVRDLAVVGTAGFLAAAVYSGYTYADTLSGDRVRWYVDTVRTSLRAVPEEAGIYPRPVPGDIVLPWNGPRRLSSHLLAPLAGEGVRGRIENPRPSDYPMVFNDAGFLVGAKPGPGSAFFGPPEGEKCIATFGGTAKWEIESLGGPSLVVGIAYKAKEETKATIVVGDAWVPVTLPAAPKGGTWYVPVEGAGTQLLLTTEENAVCMNWVTHGELVPATEGNPWEEGEDGKGDEDGDGGKGEKAGKDGKDGKSENGKSGDGGEDEDAEGQGDDGAD
ncbi:hypothetical protein CLV63_109169 [Murinocardiopsis flavida]|uniref:4-amino-4-deoxy-L-arabinose transferase-like glycosyltransferase n=1 Tax=Murinocardiopsis flavida TaxID=645275 RepID=A0A2P8DIW4_9ACTN|nr:hypothetical protein [Murinocardiopsis flavida]PSK97165.1 hypothetical protein CLV63_109169 [Murinocardiopsis flavida]